MLYYFNIHWRRFAKIIPLLHHVHGELVIYRFYFLSARKECCWYLKREEVSVSGYKVPNISYVLPFGLTQL